MKINERTARSERKSSNRRRLLEAAAAVIAEKGYRGASLDEIAQRAGLTKGAVYSNFDSKEELFFELLDAVAVSGDLTAFVDTDRTLDQQLREYAGSLAHLARSEQLHAQIPLELEFALLAFRDQRARAKATTSQQFTRRSLAAWLELRAKESGLALPLPAEQLATALIALLRGLMQQAAFEPGTVPDSLFTDAVTLLVGLPVGSDPTPSAADERR